MSEWVSVKERLPEWDQCVLVVVKGGGMVTAQWSKMVEDWTNYGWSGYEWDWILDDEPVTHWMPLPEPPVFHLTEGRATVSEIGRYPEPPKEGE